MKKFIFLILIVCFALSYGQDKIPKEYVPPEGKISLSSSMPFFQAIQAISEISSRIERKVIIDPQTRTAPINVEVVDLPWREALELILKVNELSYEEYPNYIKIVGEGEAPSKEKAKEYNSGMREVNISAIFFEGDRHELKEKGINWEAIIQKDNILMTIKQNLVGVQTEDDVFSAGATRETPDKTLNALLKALESKELGEVLARPNIQVIEGKEGRVQVGQDFSIKQRDFAGNVTDKFLSSGIILVVTPLVIQEDSLTFIHLEVSAERSSVNPGPISTIIKKTSANTSLFLLDGERAAIAGLFSTDYSTQRYGIPILKDLPGWFLGIRYLTGYDKKERTEKELVIILKAELIPSLRKRKISEIKDLDFIDKKKEEIKGELEIK